MWLWGRILHESPPSRANSGQDLMESLRLGRQPGLIDDVMPAIRAPIGGLGREVDQPINWQESG